MYLSQNMSQQIEYRSTYEDSASIKADSKETWKKYLG